MNKGTTGAVPSKRRFTNRNLLMVAVLSGIGGVFSAYVSYLANLLNKVFGVPFGAGQFVSGLHIFWIVLAAGLVRKPGIATIAGLLKGTVEFLAGGSHGIVIILVSLIEGIAIDLVFYLFRHRHNIVSYIVAGAVGSAINVVVFQILFFSGAPFGYLVAITLLAAASGAILAGVFGFEIVQIVQRARPFQMDDIEQAPSPPALSAGRKTGRIIAALLFVAMCVGGVIYFLTVYVPPWVDSDTQGAVTGLVENQIGFDLVDYAEEEVTIIAELIGDYQHIPPQEYTGIPVHVILADAAPTAEATTLSVVATDGYNLDFDLATVMQDENFILIQEGDTLRLIAADYEGGHWVRMVYLLEVK